MQKKEGTCIVDGACKGVALWKPMRFTEKQSYTVAEYRTPEAVRKVDDVSWSSLRQVEKFLFNVKHHALN